MKLKINNKEIIPVINLVDEDTKYLYEQLNALLNQIGELRTIWMGNDSDTFCGYAEEYIKYLQTIPEIYNSLNKVMKFASANYQKIDKEYASRMKKAVAMRHE